MNAEQGVQERPLTAPLTSTEVDFVGCPDESCSKHPFVYDIPKGTVPGTCTPGCGMQRIKRTMYVCGGSARCDYADKRPQQRAGKCDCGEERVALRN